MVNLDEPPSTKRNWPVFLARLYSRSCRYPILLGGGKPLDIASRGVQFGFNGSYKTDSPNTKDYPLGIVDCRSNRGNLDSIDNTVI